MVHQKNKRKLFLFFIAFAFSSLQSNVGSLSSPRSVAQIKALGPTCNALKLPRSPFPSNVSSSSSSSFVSGSFRLVALTSSLNSCSRRSTGLLSSLRASAQVRVLCYCMKSSAVCLGAQKREEKKKDKFLGPKSLVVLIYKDLEPVVA